MTQTTLRTRLLATLLPGLLVLAACFDEPPVESGVTVFDDAFGSGLAPNPFENSSLTALSVDEDRAHEGLASIRLEVPPRPAYAGGAVLAAEPRDLSRTNALAFWVMGSREATVDELGFSLDFDAEPSPYRTGVYALPVTGTWTRHVIPLPDPARLTAEKGMFYYVATDQTGYTVWFDDVRYDTFDAATLDLRPSLATTTRPMAVGGTATVAGLSLRYTDLDGMVRTLGSTAPESGPATAFFRFASSDPSVASVDENGLVTAVGVGEAAITATLAGEAVPGAFTVQVMEALPSEPTEAPPVPGEPAADVISLFSQAYDDVPVDTWRTAWSAADLTEVTVAGEPMKRYSNLDFVGVEFTGANLIDASGMDFFHVDVWTPDATTFRVKLVDFGEDGAIGGGDDSEHEVAFTAASDPALVAGTWVGLDIPFSAFADLTARAHLGQLIFSALPTGEATVYVDNVYFHR